MSATASQHDVILVTGAAGLLGSALVRKCSLSAADAQIVAVVRDGVTPAWVDEYPHVYVVNGNLDARRTWERLPTTITQVFHLAGVIDPRPPGGTAELIQQNVWPTAQLVERAAEWPQLRTVVYSSSVSVYGTTTRVVTESTTPRPASAYAAAKLANEGLLTCLRTRGVRVAMLRYTSLYGAQMRRRSVLPVMIDAANRRQEICVFGTGRRVQDFLHAEDAAMAAWQAARRAVDGVFNVGSGVSTSMAELAEQVVAVFMQGRARVTFDTTQPDGAGGYRVNISRAREQLGFEPRITLRAGLEQMGVPVGA